MRGKPTFLPSRALYCRIARPRRTAKADGRAERPVFANVGFGDGHASHAILTTRELSSKENGDGSSGSAVERNKREPPLVISDGGPQRSSLEGEPRKTERD